MIKILLADDHSLLREGLKKSFESAGDHVVGEASNGEEAVALARALQPQVVLMDLSMPVMDGIEATRRIRQEVPATRVAVLTMHDDIDKTRDAIAAGASAYLSKGTSFAEVPEMTPAQQEEVVLNGIRAVGMLGDRSLDAELERLSDAVEASRIASSMAG